MRKVDESRAANYIRKHSNYKKWLAFVLCLSLLTGTITLYTLNKPATAMTEEGAESLGVVLETASAEDEEELIRQTIENKTESDDDDGNDEDLFDFGDGDNNDDVDDDEDGDGEDADELKKSGDNAETEDLVEEEETEGEEEAEEEDELTENVVLTASYVDEDGEEIADDEEISDDLEFSEDAPSIEGYTFKKATYKSSEITKITVKKTEDDIRYFEVTFEDGEEKEIKKDATIVLTYTADEKKELVLTASYVDEAGKEIADEKELEITESFDPKKDADAIEGYTFKEAKIDEDVVTLITAIVDEESEEKYYEATLEDESTVEIKQDTEIKLTYAVVDTTVVLTANYVDKNDEEIQDSQDLNIGDKTELKKSSITEVDGYFFYKAIYEEKEITKIAPIFGEDEKEADSKKDDTEETDTKETDSEDAVVKTVGYKFITVDGDEIEITEDAEIDFTYLKASTETEFTFSDSKVTVKATVNGKNVFPEGIELKATEVTKDSAGYNYDAYMDSLNENAETIAREAGQDEATEYTEDNTLLYDIAFMFEDKELQPAEGSVSISVEFKKRQLSNDLEVVSDEDLTVLHLPLKEEVKGSDDFISTEEATDITSSDIEVKTLTQASTELSDVEKVEFEESSFSVFVFTDGSGLKNTWNGSRDITLADLAPISSLFYYSVVSNTFETYGHIEGNVRTGILATDSSSSNMNNARNGNQVQKNAITEINVVKTVQNGDNGTFKFRFYDESDNPIEGSEFEITTAGESKTGSKTINGNDYPRVFQSLNSGKSLHVYELEYDKNGKFVRVLKEGEKNNNTNFTVSYQYSDILGFDSGEIAYDHNSNYIGEFESLTGDVIAVGDNYFGAANNYIGEQSYKNGGHLYFGEDRDFMVQNAASKESMFTYVPGLKDTISSELDTAKEVSLRLADGKNYASGNNTTANLVNVLNIQSTTGTLSTDLAAVNLKDPYIRGLISEDQYLLINIAVGSKTKTYNIDGQNLKFDGKEVQDDGYSVLASHIIFNLVNADRTAPYSGTVYIANWSDGLLLAPAATVDQTKAYFTGEIIADYVKHQNSDEIHKKPLISGRAVTVNITNTGEVPYSLTIRKEFKNYDGSKIEDDAEKALFPTVKLKVWQTYDGGKPTQYGEIVIFSKDAGWEKTLENVPRYTNDGKEYKYYIQELNSSSKPIPATTGIEYYKIVNNVSSEKTINFADASISAGSDTGTIVLVCVNTKDMNVLPSTGGVGDIPYMAAGAGTAMVGLLGTGLYYRKKKDDDQEEE